MSQAFVHWFRASSPYIHAHRNRTFVISFPGQAVAEDGFNKLIHDIALLKSLGVRLVLVHGVRRQIDDRVQQQGGAARFHHHLRITDAATLQYVKQAAGLVRVETEALLSLGLLGSPMAGAKIRVASGNFVTAKPLGVLEGVDYGYTGKVRRIDAQGIHQQLQQNNLVLLSPLGYSPSGDIFNLSAVEVATEAAIALQADKLILLTEEALLSPADHSPILQLTTAQAAQLLEQAPGLPGPMARMLRAAMHGCQQGVARAHLVNRHIDGVLLLELFTRDGVGALVSAQTFETTRPANLEDIGGIMELIKPLERQGILAPRTRETLEMRINDYIVTERDGLIIACIALHLLPDAAGAELACLAVRPDYQNGERGQHLLGVAEQLAREQSAPALFVKTTQTEHWFLERGFKACQLQDLPESLRVSYNPERNSRLLVKHLAAGH